MPMPSDDDLRRRAHAARIEANVALSPQLRRIRLSAPSLQGVALPVAGKFKLQVGPGAWRSYTPAVRDVDAGAFDLIAHVHGHGPGSAWAAAARPGDATWLLGPRESFALDPDATWAVALGDETTLGLWQAVAAAHGVPLHGAVEAESDDHDAIGALGLDIDVLARGPTRGEALADWVQRDWPAGRGAFYLSGHFRSACAVRERLLAAGVPAAWIHTKAYWGEGRKARK